MNRTLIKCMIGLIILSSCLQVRAEENLIKNTTILMLGDTKVRVNVYEKAGANITFVAPHYNEQTANRLAKAFIETSGGRLIELESFDNAGNPSRRVLFKSNGRTYSIDPNRIFTDNGRACDGSGFEVQQQVKKFAETFLAMLLAPGATRLRESEFFLVAIHNNVDVGSRSIHAQRDDLTVSSFIRPGRLMPSGGTLYEQAQGVYLSNVESDEDSFVFLSSPMFADYFIENGFNVVVQTSAARSPTGRCSVDDGSLSVYSAQHNIPYISLEADNTNGSVRQRQMFNSALQLFLDRKIPKIATDTY